jgi:hypothetical protein
MKSAVMNARRPAMGRPRKLRDELLHAAVEVVPEERGFLKVVHVVLDLLLADGAQPLLADLDVRLTTAKQDRERLGDGRSFQSFTMRASALAK